MRWIHDKHILHKKFISYLFGIILVILLNIPSWMSMFEKTPLSYQDELVHVDSPIIVGDNIHLTLTRCNHNDIPIQYTTIRTLRNRDTNQAWSLPLIAVELYPGCETVESRANVLPNELPPGKYYLHAISVVVTTTNKSHTASWMSEDFIVIEK